MQSLDSMTESIWIFENRGWARSVFPSKQYQKEWFQLFR